MICLICNKQYKNNLRLSVHINNTHNLNYYQYLKKYIYKDNIPLCPYCNKQLQFRKPYVFKKTCGSYQCLTKLKQDFVHKEQTKQIMRSKRFDYLSKKLGKTAWQRRRSGEMSYLQKWFYDNIIIKYKLIQKYDIVNQLPIYPYFIDFAFLNIKLAVELDGKFHQRPDRVQHDIKKQQKLKSLGWKIFRILWVENNEEKQKQFLYTLNNIQNYQTKKLQIKLYKGSLKKYFKKERQLKIKQNKIIISNKYKQEVIIKYQKYIDILKNSNIDFSKFGWVQKARKLTGLKHQKIRKIIEKYFKNEFINIIFYKKKINIGPQLNGRVAGFEPEDGVSTTSGPVLF